MDIKSHYVFEITLDIRNKNYFEGRMKNWYVVGPSSIFFFFFLIAPLWNSLKWNVILQIMVLPKNFTRHIPHPPFIHRSSFLPISVPVKINCILGGTFLICWITLPVDLKNRIWKKKKILVQRQIVEKCLSRAHLCITEKMLPTFTN